ncbi:MAG: sugar ABC transporter ATP-binding protein [Gemmataceae bacterium]|nr:sugar ABC transporter ATP-binding protein [Gemmataceae bacterium]
MTPRVELRDVGKQFAGVWVLRGVTLTVPPGAVLGLVGENGAGKSTLMNVLAGVHRPDAGTIRVDGADYAPRSPAEAAAAGIALVHQELNLFPNLSVGENLFLDRLPTKGAVPLRRVDRPRLRADAEEALAVVGLAVDPGRPVSGLSPGERQLVEVAKGLAAGARVLILDEPTTSLTRPEADRLFALVRQVRAAGKSVVYISHNLPDVLGLCDAVAVLRDGALVAHGPAGEFTEDRLITLMVGRQLDQVYPQRATGPTAEPLLELDRLTRPGAAPVSLTVHRGEVVGVAGLMGAGRTELARAVFGLDPVTAGDVRLGGELLAALTPAARIRKGLAFLTEDRRGDGLLMDAALTDEVSLAALPRHGPWLRPGRLRQAVAAAAIRVNLSQGRLDERTARTLSGGNQQKAVLAKWLLAGPRVLILDEPTRGVDVGARAEIYRTINELVKAGLGVLLISSEVEELLGMRDRILVMAGGAVRAEFRRPEFDREAILRAALAGRAA